MHGTAGRLPRPCPIWQDWARIRTSSSGLSTSSAMSAFVAFVAFGRYGRNCPVLSDSSPTVPYAAFARIPFVRFAPVCPGMGVSELPRLGGV